VWSPDRFDFNGSMGVSLSMGVSRGSLEGLSPGGSLELDPLIVLLEMDQYQHTASSPLQLVSVPLPGPPRGSPGLGGLLVPADQVWEEITSHVENQEVTQSCPRGARDLLTCV